MSRFLHTEVSTTVSSKNASTKIDKDEIILVMKYEVNINKLIYAGSCRTTKLNSFQLGYLLIYLSYRICKFDFFVLSVV